MYQTIYHNGSYLLLLGKRRNKDFKFHTSYSFHFKNGASPKAPRTLKLQNWGLVLIKENTVCHC